MNNSLLYLITVLIWGSTWIAINFQLGEVAPEASIAYRFAIASAILIIFCFATKRSLKFDFSAHKQFMAFGLCLFSGNYYFVYTAQLHINSALTCIAFSTLMLVNIINARIWYKTPITMQSYIGGLLGISGIGSLFWPELSDIDVSTDTIIGLALCMVGVLLASTGNMISMNNQKKKLPLVQANTWGMFYGTVFMLIILFATGKKLNFSTQIEYISSLIYLALFGSVIGFSCYLTLLNKIGAHKASYANIMFPAVAVALSTFFEGFEWNAHTMIGFVCMIIGNLVVLAKPINIAVPFNQRNKKLLHRK